VNRRAVGAIAAQAVQALASFVLQVAVAHLLGISGLGAFAILYGVVVLASGVVTGFVGDTLVVLDRGVPAIRSALQQAALVLAVGAGLIGAAFTTASGLTTPAEGGLFVLAVAVFCLEEVLRRTLMARLLFWRVVATDATGLVVALSTVAVAALLGVAGLGTFLIAIALGQSVAIVVGATLLPREERHLVRFHRGGMRAVLGYGTWRSLQQFLRPALLTAVRSTVGVVAGLTATGLLEAARVYTAPTLLLVSGLSSYLFASYAKERSATNGLRRADRAVAGLVVFTVLVGVVALVLLPVAGPVLFAAAPQPLAVAGWLLYSVSVAAVTPYGALAAVAGRQALVFAIRAGDTLLSLAAVLVGLGIGIAPAWAPALMVIGSLAGGLALRRIAGSAARSAATGATELQRTV
jgi:O-antigen/teichoic acid export membrane protein